MAAALRSAAECKQHRVANESIYSDKYLKQNANGTTTEVERRIRLNGDRSEMVIHFDSHGVKIVVWHVVHNAQGRLLHLDEKFRRTGDSTTWPPEGYGF